MTPSVAPATPYFPYNNVVTNIRGFLGSEQTYRFALISGGRGMGKSTVLAALVEDGGADMVSGRFLEHALQRLAEWFRDPPPIAYIDDLHKLVADRAALTRVSELAAKALDGGRFGIVSCSTLEPFELARICQTDASSLLVAHSQHARLDPWAINWRAAVARAVQAVMKTKDAAVEKAWVEALETLTGGHPSLMGAGLARLRDLEAQATMAESDLPPAVARLVTPAVPREQLREWLLGELHASSELLAVTKAVAALESTRAPLAARLRSLAKGKREIFDHTDKTVLGSFGLLSATFGEAQAVPGQVLRELLGTPPASEVVRPPPIPAAAPAPPPAAFGRPVTLEGLHLPRTGRQLLDILVAGGETYTSVSALQARLGVATDRAVGGVIFRLRAAIRLHLGWDSSQDPLEYREDDKAYRLIAALRKPAGR